VHNASPPPLQKGLRPHNYCLPILKRERHREAVAAAATSGSAKFFLGTDSAPHAVHTKEAPCGCAGIFSAPIALSLYAMAFEQVGVCVDRRAAVPTAGMRCSNPQMFL
jgi:dihydroorotase